MLKRSDQYRIKDAANVKLRSVIEKDAQCLIEKWSPNRLEGYCLPSDESRMGKLIEQWNAGIFDGRRFAMFAIEEAGDIVGLLSLYECQDALSIGVSVDKMKRCRGIARAAVFAAIPLALQMGYNKMVAENCTDNVPSITVCKRCGFVCTGKTVNAKGNEVLHWNLIF